MVNVGKSAIHGPYRVMENQNKSADDHLLHLAMMKGHDGKDLTSSAEGGECQDQFPPEQDIPHDRDKEIGLVFFCVGKIRGRNQQKILNKWWVSVTRVPSQSLFI